MQDMPSQGRLLQLGPPAFVPHTSWKAWSAGLATAFILIAGLFLSAALAGLLVGLGVKLKESELAIAVLAGWQVITIALTLAFASWGGRPADALSLRAPSGTGVYVRALAMLLVLQVAATGLEYLFVPEQMFRDLRSFVEIARGSWWVPGLVVVGIGAPLAEELLFRGFLFAALAKSRLSIAGAALISTALWTGLHAGYSPAGLIEIFVVGLYFSWLLWRTGSLRVTLVCHAVYNALIMLGLRYLPLPAGLLPA